MNSGVFRKKSMERVSSPEQLNDYIRVSNPGIWLILGAVIVLLIGAVVWGASGELETGFKTWAHADADGQVCYITEAERAKIDTDTFVRAGSAVYGSYEISQDPVTVDDVITKVGSLEAYKMQIGVKEGDRLYEVRLQDGVAKAAGDAPFEIEFVLDSVSPLSFILG